MSITLSMNAAATCGTMALPYPLILSNRAGIPGVCVRRSQCEPSGEPFSLARADYRIAVLAKSDHQRVCQVDRLCAQIVSSCRKPRVVDETHANTSFFAARVDEIDRLDCHAKPNVHAVFAADLFRYGVIASDKNIEADRGRNFSFSHHTTHYCNDHVLLRVVRTSHDACAPT